MKSKNKKITKQNSRFKIYDFLGGFLFRKASQKTGFRCSLRLLTEFFNASLCFAEIRDTNWFCTSQQSQIVLFHPLRFALLRSGELLRGCSNPCRKHLILNLQKKLLFSFLMLLFLSKNLYSQETLSNLNTSWTNVLTGTVICQPVTTSYGFCIATDAKTICGFSNNGVLLWENTIQKSKNIKLTCLYEKFIILSDIQNNKITLFNPNGKVIWSKKLNYTQKQDLFCGRDGRFFVQGENIIECYGLNGILKWQIKTEKQNSLNMQELSDGSLLIFLQEVKGKTKGLRISPFGSITEEILFSGKIKKTYTCNQGILLIFEDNLSGLFSLQDNLSKNNWVIKNDSNLIPIDFVVSKDSEKILFMQKQKNNTVFNQINPKTGQITNTFTTDIINPDNIKYFLYQNENIFISDNKNSCIFSSDGKLLWNAKNPEEKSYNYELLTNDNHLVFFSKDWSLNAYHIFNKKYKITPQKKDYNSFLNITDNQFDVLYSSSFSRQLVNEDRILTLLQGNYGEKEKQWLSEVISISNMYLKYLDESNFGTREQISVFQKDSVGFEKILRQLLLFCNFQTLDIAAQITEKETDTSFLIAVLSGISKNGCDPDEKLLQALEKLSEKVNTKDVFLINTICDSVFSICTFMGQSAFYSKGKSILKKFMYPQYSSVNRDYARDILKKISDENF